MVYTCVWSYKFKPGYALLFLSHEKKGFVEFVTVIYLSKVLVVFSDYFSTLVYHVGEMIAYGERY